jgi:hypothetical protein
MLLVSKGKYIFVYFCIHIFQMHKSTIILDIKSNVYAGGPQECLCLAMC